jgi:hypothetical protein
MGLHLALALRGLQYAIFLLISSLWSLTEKAAGRLKGIGYPAG